MTQALIDRFTTLLRVTTYSNALARDVTTFERSGSASDAAQLVTGEIDKIKTTSMQNISRDRGVRAGLELLLGLSILFVLCRPLAIMYSFLIPFTSFVASRFAKGMFRAAGKEGEAAKKQVRVNASSRL
jgi:ABC-type multidrug transport system fused ATPase/permease subunit